MSEILAKDNGITLKKHIEDALDSFREITGKLNQFDENLKKSIEWSIRLHDIGKVLPYFQIRYLKNKDYKPWEITINIYHSLLSVLSISQEKLKKLVGEDDYPYVLSAIAYHHWKNKLEYDLRFGSDIFEKFKNQGKDFFDNLMAMLKKSIGDLLQGENDIIDINIDMLTGLSNGISFDDYVLPPYQLYWLPKRIETNEESKKRWILISGFLQRCDHFASFCEENGKTGSVSIEYNNLKYEEIIEKIKNAIKKKYENEGKIYQPEKLTLWQKKSLEQAGINNNIILTAPTGCGKTEFAFLWSNGEKLFYTLPLRAAVEQIYDRAKKIFEEDKTGLLHSDADVYLLGDTYDIEKIKVYEVAQQLSYPVIISTGDQFFPYSLRPPGYERIYATFSYSRVAIDEVQAYNPKSAAIVVKYIEDIHRLGGKFLLMTATLPEYVKDEIEKRTGGNFKEINKYEEERNTYKNFKKHKIFFKLISNNVNDKKIDFSFSDDLITEIVKQADDGKRVMIILNTVKQANDLYQKIKKYKHKTLNENIILFHSQFTLNKKNNIKDEIEKKFKNPKPDDENEGKILVATQVVEAALDFDADVLYTEIAPMDSLIQRMGRVLRRYQQDFQLSENDKANVYIIVFENGYESGNGRVYDRELIEKTLIIFDNIQDLDKIDYKLYYKKWDFQIEKLKITQIDKIKKKKGKQEKQGNSLQREILLSEIQKSELVNKLYKDLDSDRNYLSDFYKTLDILDAGFMSDRKEEAQRIFREIISVDVIFESQKDKFEKAMYDFIEKKDKDINYTLFKKEIAAEFFISIPLYNLQKKKIKDLNEWIKEMQIDYNIKQKLLNWCDKICIIKDEDSIKSEENII